MNIIYREAAPEDAQALLDYLKIIGSESDNLSFGAGGLPFTEDQEKAFLASQQRSSHSMILLAFDGSEIVGNASIAGTDNARFGHRKSLAISVRKDHWGQGIGSGLMERLIAFARECGSEVISLEVRSDNHRAKALYEKFGFQSYGVYEKFFKIEGTYFSADFMNLYL